MSTTIRGLRYSVSSFARISCYMLENKNIKYDKITLKICETIPRIVILSFVSVKRKNTHTHIGKTESVVVAVVLYTQLVVGSFG